MTTLSIPTGDGVRDTETLPSGARFAFWADATVYRTVYHVAQQHPEASDANPGTAEAPFHTIDAAARRLQPGEKVVIHAGIYRECVRPARGGASAEAMIAYEAAPGERVVVRGSDRWTPECRPSAGYALPGSAEAALNLRPERLEVFLDSPALQGEGVKAPLTAPIWMAELPDHFTDGYNPFLVRNAYAYMPQLNDVGDVGFFQRALQRRGTLFVDGIPLAQVHHFRELAVRDGAFWVEEPGLRLHVRLCGDADPTAHLLEVTMREQLFAPRDFGLGYLRVSGLIFEHAADGVPAPQRAAVSTMRGHHWIIEGCEVAWANAVGMDIGAQTWDATLPHPTGGHLLRHNTIRQCGICGLAGALGVHHTLIEGNTIEEIGGLDLERLCENAGIKFHAAEHCLIRGNVLRHIRNASGLWLDCSNLDNRITHNIFADIETYLAAAFMEMNFDANLLDHNIFWDIRAPLPAGGGVAVLADCNESLVVAHNFFGQCQGYGVMFALGQASRQHQGRTGLCRANAAYNNVFYRCPHRVSLGRLEENHSDGNLFDIRDDTCSFEIARPEPGCLQHLAGWQRYFDQDRHATQARLTAEFDLASGVLRWHTDDPLPTTQPVPTLPASAWDVRPGPAGAAADPAK